MVEYSTTGVGLMRCLLVMVEETVGLAGVLEVDGTAEVWTELEVAGFVELIGALEVDGTAEVACELDGTTSCLIVKLRDTALEGLAELTVDVVLLVVALDVTGTDEDVLTRLLLDGEVECTLETELTADFALEETLDAEDETVALVLLEVEANLLLDAVVLMLDALVERLLLDGDVEYTLETELTDDFALEETLGTELETDETLLDEDKIWCAELEDGTETELDEVTYQK